MPHISCKSIVKENMYVDKYYLDDYVHFYASCHRTYSKLCQRLHFFKTNVNHDDLFSSDKSIKQNWKKITWVL